MRVFAGPNGSGKSTIIKSVRNYKTDNRNLDFGIYINADDIVVKLKKDKFNFSSYKIKTTEKEFKQIALTSGLIDPHFTRTKFESCFQLTKQHIILKNADQAEKLGQILADFLRKKLLSENKKFSFETVFSHGSKLQIMEEARLKGYKVYLYFVSTNSPDINKERVKLRAKEGGHDVPPDKIVDRYYRSLGLMYKAAQLSYQAFFFDNSGELPRMFTNFRLVNGDKDWKKAKEKDIPDWFINYYKP